MDTTLTDPLVGRVLEARYRVETRIARGGMASVYTATDLRLDRTVAVKVMHPALADDADFVARFIREARAAASLSHPNVVAVYDQGADGDCVFLVMEHVAGWTVRDLLRERSRLRAGEALAVMEPVLAALAAAHDAGLVHRDVKPENVLLAADGRVKVADFGLARAVAGSTLTGGAGMLLGTVAYLAPEQVERGTADARSDVYSAGVVLYELLAGHPPFTGETPLAVAYRHVHDRVPRPGDAVPGVPPGLDALVASATGHDPARRPADAGALLVRLARLRDELGSADRVPLPSGRATAPIVLPDPPARSAQATSVLPTVVAGPDADAGSGSSGQDADPGDPPGRRRRRWPYVVIPLLLAAAAAGVAGWWFGAGRYTSAPSLLGDTMAQASNAADTAGLHVRAGSPVYSDTVRTGLVVDQRPALHASLLRGSTITVALSLGVEKHPVPNVAGKSPQAAGALLAAAKLTVAGTRSSYSSSVPQGTVISTDPGAGTVLRHGSGVTLVVSAGPAPVALPDVTGQPLDQATQTLTTAGFKVTTPSHVYSDTVPSGSVVSMSPQGGSGQVAQNGATIALTVSKGPHLYRVPSVRGEAVDQAVADLQAAGFVPKVDAFPGGPGIVLSQNPGGGSMQRKGTTVTLYVF